MSQEIRALISAIVAGVLVLAITFGVSALFKKATETRSVATSSTASLGGESTASTSPSQVIAGKALYAQYCSSCHGADASGGFGPSLQHEDWNDQRITNIVVNGKSPMPPFKGKMTAGQVQSVVEFVDSMK